MAYSDISVYYVAHRLALAAAVDTVSRSFVSLLTEKLLSALSQQPVASSILFLILNCECVCNNLNEF